MHVVRWLHRKNCCFTFWKLINARVVSAASCVSMNKSLYFCRESMIPCSYQAATMVSCDTNTFNTTTGSGKSVRGSRYHVGVAGEEGDDAIGNDATHLNEKHAVVANHCRILASLELAADCYLVVAATHDLQNNNNIS